MNAYASPSPLPPLTCSELVEPIKGGGIYDGDPSGKFPAFGGVRVRGM